MNQIKVQYIKSKKHIDIKPSVIRYLTILLINNENPSFDSQTKDYLKPAISDFGSYCEISDVLKTC